MCYNLIKTKRRKTMAKKSITSFYDNLPWIAKIIIQAVLGAVVGGVYRILKFVESKNILTLIMAILGLVTGIGNLIFWIIDLFTMITTNKISFFAD